MPELPFVAELILFACEDSLEVMFDYPDAALQGICTELLQNVPAVYSVKDPVVSWDDPMATDVVLHREGLTTRHVAWLRRDLKRKFESRVPVAMACKENGEDMSIRWVALPTRTGYEITARRFVKNTYRRRRENAPPPRASKLSQGYHCRELE